MAFVWKIFRQCKPPFSQFGPFESATFADRNAMTGIRATCSTCGDVNLTINDVRLRLCIETDQGEFRFRCKKCDKVTVNQISGPTFDLLLSTGVECYEWHLPAELYETHEGPQISNDDVREFRNTLVDLAAFEAAIASIADDQT